LIVRVQLGGAERVDLLQPCVQRLDAHPLDFLRHLAAKLPIRRRAGVQPAQIPGNTFDSRLRI
jgi:hypothetical protein